MRVGIGPPQGHSIPEVTSVFIPPILVEGCVLCCFLSIEQALDKWVLGKFSSDEQDQMENLLQVVHGYIFCFNGHGVLFQSFLVLFGRPISKFFASACIETNPNPNWRLVRKFFVSTCIEAWRRRLKSPTPLPQRRSIALWWRRTDAADKSIATGLCDGPCLGLVWVGNHQWAIMHAELPVHISHSIIMCGYLKGCDL